MTDPDLSRFVEAQAMVLAKVAMELAAGRKRSHWMWFIFPQLKGLGHSAMAEHYAIRGLDQARRFLGDARLGESYRRNVRLMLSHKEFTAHQILGSPDDMKFRSSLTLFHAATTDASDRELLSQALDRFYNGEPDLRTLAMLGKDD